jgi:hypothetical protein
MNKPKIVDRSTGKRNWAFLRAQAILTQEECRLLYHVIWAKERELKPKIDAMRSEEMIYPENWKLIREYQILKKMADKFAYASAKISQVREVIPVSR